MSIVLTCGPSFHSSVAAEKEPAGFIAPPKAKAAVLVPAPPNLYLAVPKSATSVQFVPFQDSAKA